MKTASTIRKRASRCPNQRGFTLLEVLVATAIMGIAVAGVMSGLAQSARNVERITQYDRAAFLARQRMDEMLADQTLPRGAQMEGRFTPQQTGLAPGSGLEMGWTARIDPYETYSQGLAGNGWAVDRIELEIWWNDGPVRRSFSLESYRRGLLRDQDANLRVITNQGVDPSALVGPGGLLR